MYKYLSKITVKISNIYIYIYIYIANLIPVYSQYITLLYNCLSFVFLILVVFWIISCLF